MRTMQEETKFTRMRVKDSLINLGLRLRDLNFNNMITVKKVLFKLRSFSLKIGLPTQLIILCGNNRVKKYKRKLINLKFILVLFTLHLRLLKISEAH